MNGLLQLLQKNARYTNEELSVMLGTSLCEVEMAISELENTGVIRGYKAIVDHEKEDKSYVAAIIELRVTPKRDLGFDEIACRIAQFDEVEDVYLMSGGYDLALVISGKTFKDIALFVSQRLATLDSVVSTATHFVLSRYKEKGIIIGENTKDERGNASL